MYNNGTTGISGLLASPDDLLDVLVRHLADRPYPSVIDPRWEFRGQSNVAGDWLSKVTICEEGAGDPAGLLYPAIKTEREWLLVFGYDVSGRVMGCELMPEAITVHHAGRVAECPDTVRLGGFDLVDEAEAPDGHLHCLAPEALRIAVDGPALVARAGDPGWEPMAKVVIDRRREVLPVDLLPEIRDDHDRIDWDLPRAAHPETWDPDLVYLDHTVCPDGVWEVTAIFRDMIDPSGSGARAMAEHISWWFAERFARFPRVVVHDTKTRASSWA